MRAAVAEWLKAPVPEPKTWVQYSGGSSLSSNQDYIKSSTLICFSIVYNIFCSMLDMIRGYQVLFSVKMSQKLAF